MALNAAIVRLLALFLAPSLVVGPSFPAEGLGSGAGASLIPNVGRECFSDQALSPSVDWVVGAFNPSAKARDSRWTAAEQPETHVRVEIRRSTPVRDTGLTAAADRFEQQLISIFNMPPQQIHRGRVTVDRRDYPFTMTRTNVSRELFYFRAGNHFVLNPAAYVWATVRGHGTQLQQALTQYRDIVWLSENEAGSQTYLYRDRPNGSFMKGGTPYLLPEAIGILIALQHIEKHMNGHPVVDLGSRNAMYSASALLAGASRAVAIENEPESIDVLPSESSRFGLPEGPQGLIQANLLFNAVQDRVRVREQAFREVPGEPLDGGVVIYNFPLYGFQYDNASPELRRAIHKTAEFGRLDPHIRPSLLADIRAKYPHARWIIASGGSSTLEEDDLRAEAERLGLREVTRIPVDNPLKTGTLETIETFSTFIFEAPSRSLVSRWFTSPLQALWSLFRNKFLPGERGSWSSRDSGGTIRRQAIHDLPITPTGMQTLENAGFNVEQFLREGHATYTPVGGGASFLEQYERELLFTQAAGPEIDFRPIVRTKTNVGEPASGLKTRREFFEMVSSLIAAIVHGLSAPERPADDVLIRQLDDADATVRRQALEALRSFTGVPQSILTNPQSRNSRHQITAALKITAVSDPQRSLQMARMLFLRSDPDAVALFGFALQKKYETDHLVGSTVSSLRATLRAALAGGEPEWTVSPEQEAQTIARRYLQTSPGRIQQAAPWQIEFLVMAQLIAIAIDAEKELKPWNAKEFGILLKKILDRTDVDPSSGHYMNSNFEIGPSMLSPAVSSAVLRAAHEVGHNWVDSRSAPLRDQTSMNLKAIDEFIALAFGLARLESLNLIPTTNAQQILEGEGACVSCGFAPGVKILADDAGRILVGELLRDPQKHNNSWKRLWKSIDKQIHRVRPDTSFTDFAYHVLHDADIPFDWTTFPAFAATILPVARGSTSDAPSGADQRVLDFINNPAIREIDFYRMGYYGPVGRTVVPRLVVASRQRSMRGERFETKQDVGLALVEPPRRIPGLVHKDISLRRAAAEETTLELFDALQRVPELEVISSSDKFKILASLRVLIRQGDDALRKHLKRAFGDKRPLEPIVSALKEKELKAYSTLHAALPTPEDTLAILRNLPAFQNVVSRSRGQTKVKVAA